MHLNWREETLSKGAYVAFTSNMHSDFAYTRFRIFLLFLYTPYIVLSSENTFKTSNYVYTIRSCLLQKVVFKRIFY